MEKIRRVSYGVLDFEKLETDTFYLYVPMGERTLGGQYAVGVYNNALSVALTMEEVDLCIKRQYPNRKKKVVSEAELSPLKKYKYLAKDELQSYTQLVYGETFELHVSEKIRFRLDNVRGNFSDSLLHRESGERRPGYLMRGADVTPEQAYELFMRLEGDAFRGYFHPSVAISDMNFYNIFSGGPFDRENKNAPGLEKLRGAYVRSWMDFDGTIGTDAVTQKYPTMIEFIEELTIYAAEFPFLDLAIRITGRDEWRNWNEETNDLEHMIKYAEFTEVQDLDDLDEFDEFNEFGFIVKDGIFTILEEEQFAPVFKEYYEKYDYNKRHGIVLAEYDWIDADCDNPDYVNKYSEESTQTIFDPPFENIEEWLHDLNQRLLDATEEF